jgi:hypothetical protein
MSKEKNQPIFIQYVNTSLKDYPEIFWQLYTRFIEKYTVQTRTGIDSSNPDPFDRMVRALVDSLKIFAVCENAKDALQISETELAKIDRYEEIFQDVGRETALKWGLEACFDACDECPYRDYTPMGGGEGKRCYECVQEIFKRSLRRFIETKELTGITKDGLWEWDINFLAVLVSNCMRFARLQYSIQHAYPDEDRTFTTQICLEEKLFDKSIFSPLRRYTPFHDLFFHTIVGGDFANFLRNEDRRKLKNCSRCGKLFVASKNDSRFIKCEDCTGKKATDRQRIAQANRRRAQRDQKKRERHEARIKNMMDRGGWTRGEVEEFIKADSEV